jgi:hypothetical protein
MRLANHFITRLGPLGNDTNPKNATVVHPFDIISTCVTAALRWSFGFKMMAKLDTNLGILVHSTPRARAPTAPLPSLACRTTLVPTPRASAPTAPLPSLACRTTPVPHPTTPNYCTAHPFPPRTFQAPAPSKLKSHWLAVVRNPRCSC